MKLFLESRARWYATSAVTAILLLAGCSGSRTLPSAESVGPQSSATHVTVGGLSSALVFPDACSDPKKLKVCVTPGGTVKLKLTLTCHLGTQSASCGTVTWSTKTSNKGLKAKFGPNPGDPTRETVTAAKTMKVGHYSQEITSKCTGVPNCDYTSKGAIWIIK